jgi:retron-type reverse transcriptase
MNRTFFSAHSASGPVARLTRHYSLYVLPFMSQRLRWVLDIDIEKYLDRDSYCTPAYEVWLKRSV